MRILAIDTAMSAVAVCVLDSNDKTPLASESIEMRRGHAEALMPMIERIVNATPGGFGALDRIAVTVGPGSFTGIRVGVSAARAISMALSKPAVGVSTLAALAAPLILARDDRAIFACIDARHGQCFGQLFSGAGGGAGHASVMKIEDAVTIIGSEKCRLVGSGAALVAAEAIARGFRMEIATNVVVSPIAFVAMLGLLGDPGAGKPRPVYLKAVDAKPMPAARPTAIY